MFMNIHARFLFEDAFYKERAKGIVSEKRLNELMVEAQKEAYGDRQLATIHTSGVVSFTSLLMEYHFITSRTHLDSYSA